MYVFGPNNEKRGYEVTTTKRIEMDLNRKLYKYMWSEAFNYDNTSVSHVIHNYDKLCIITLLQYLLSEKKPSFIRKYL